MRIIHELKTIPVYFSRTETGTKKFELRRNDRDFQVGDILRLEEWIPESKTFTGKQIDAEVTYILNSQSPAVEHIIQDGWVVMGIEIINKNEVNLPEHFEKMLRGDA
jgi:hypothetical protein